MDAPRVLASRLRRRLQQTLAKGDAGYEDALPSGQTAVDVFRGEWVSQLPDGLVSGGVPLFADERIDWLASQIDLAGCTVLELGPLEGGHSFMLERFGAERVVAIEANRRAYLRCLVVKEILGLRRVEFLCGDLIEYLRETEQTFGLCLASGILYHMRDPFEMLRLAARVSDQLYLWTHYYDAELIHANPQVAVHFPSDEGPPFRFEYQESRNARRFCGSGGRHSNWLDRASIIRVLGELGFDRLEFAFDEPNHQNGPAVAIFARQSHKSPSTLKQ
jgi:Protein of unknown function (DUF1698)